MFIRNTYRLIKTILICSFLQNCLLYAELRFTSQVFVIIFTKLLPDCQLLSFRTTECTLGKYVIRHKSTKQEPSKNTQ